MTVFIGRSNHAFSRNHINHIRKCSNHIQRYSNLNNEFDRLVSHPKVRRRLEIIDHFLKYHADIYSPLYLDMPRKIAFGRALEVFEKFKNTHFTFFHGQPSIHFLPLNILKTSFLFWSNLDQLSKFSCVLRDPANLQGLDVNIHNVEWYKSRITRINGYRENDEHHRTALIAADGYLVSTTCEESALYYFCGANTLVEKVAGESFYEIVNNHIINDKKGFIDKFSELKELCVRAQEQYTYEKGAILYTICIPKNHFSNCGYLSYPFGIPIEINQNEVHPLLEQMQNEEEANKNFPQIRILTHQLQSNKAQVFMFSTMPDGELEELIVKIRSLIREHWPLLKHKGDEL